MKPELILKLTKLRNLTHVKESSSDVTRIWKIRALTKDGVTVFCGADNLALESFLMGARGTAVADVSTAFTEYQLAKERGIGTPIDLSGV